MVACLRRRFGLNNVGSLGFLLVVVCAPLGGRGARAQAPQPAITLDQLLGMSPAEIENVYRQGTAAAIPPGRVRGTALVASGNQAATSYRAGAPALARKGL